MDANGFEDMRRAMVASQLRTNAVTDVRVLDAMGSVPREDFVPAERRGAAYADLPVPLGDGRAINPPMVLARLLNEAGIAPDDSVLIVGNAADYAVAVAKLLSTSVTHATGPDAARGGHFDVIVIDGAVEVVPDTLIALLKPAGRLATGIVDQGVTRLAIGRRGGAGFGLIAFADADAVILPEFARAAAFAF